MLLMIPKIALRIAEPTVQYVYYIRHREPPAFWDAFTRFRKSFHGNIGSYPFGSDIVTSVPSSSQICRMPRTVSAALKQRNETYGRGSRAPRSERRSPSWYTAVICSRDLQCSITSSQPQRRQNPFSCCPRRQFSASLQSHCAHNRKNRLRQNGIDSTQLQILGISWLPPHNFV